MKMRAAFLLLVFAICGCYAENLVELATNLGASTLVGFVQKARLSTVLEDYGPFTIFAPTDAAFAALPSNVVDELGNNTGYLREVLMFHVLDGRTYSSQLTNDLTAQTIVPSLKIRINIYNKTVTADGAKVTLPDNNATNGVVHVIDRVMFPLPVSAIFDTIIANSDLTTLLFLVDQAQLLGLLRGPGPFTLFAPTNAAFKVLPSGAISDLLSNQTALLDVVKYHVVPVTAYSAGLASGHVTTLQGGDVSIKVTDSGVKVNKASVVTPDIPTTNGVIHIIDQVLLPSN